MTNSQQSPTIIFIFGGSGDLAQRKLLPALYNLFIDQCLPQNYKIIGIGRTEYTNEAYREIINNGIKEFSRRKEALPKYWSDFSKNIDYASLDVNSDEGFAALAEIIDKNKKEWKEDPNLIYYMSVAPQLAPAISTMLHKHKLASNPHRHRMVFEKPFGSDLKTARELNDQLQNMFDEEQIYRIDHFLGKEAVQNILALRFANSFFEPIWNNNYIDHVQITAIESVSAEDRGGYYERSGALRDMVQNHMLQLLCMIAMEPPISFEANEMRNKKADVLRAIKKFDKSEVDQYAVRGQYGAGWVNGKKVCSYRDEKGVNPHSNVETYAAVKFFVNNWRWNGVPFYVRTGKSLVEKSTQIVIQFKRPPNFAFPAEAVQTWRSNRLVINISPKLDIRLRFQAKQPGQKLQLKPVDMVFNYFEDTAETQPEAYETLLQDVIEGNPTLFMRADQVDAAWEVITPILEVWQCREAIDFPNYGAGSWGPEDAEALIAADGNRWITMPVPDGSEDEE